VAFDLFLAARDLINLRLDQLLLLLLFQSFALVLDLLLFLLNCCIELPLKLLFVAVVTLGFLLP
jgi:hypothetical protein